jgi:hypothetical protein
MVNPTTKNVKKNVYFWILILYDYIIYKYIMIVIDLGRG